MVSQKGIEVNLEKIKAIVEMKPLRTEKERFEDFWGGYSTLVGS